LVGLDKDTLFLLLDPVAGINDQPVERRKLSIGVVLKHGTSTTFSVGRALVGRRPLIVGHLEDPHHG
jgi:hypothetical protein